MRNVLNRSGWGGCGCGLICTPANETLYYQWGQKLHVVASGGTADWLDLSLIPTVYAPFSADAGGVASGSRPLTSSGTWGGRCAIDLGTEAQTLAVGTAAVREYYPGASGDRTVAAAIFDDDNNRPGQVHTFDYDTQSVVNAVVIAWNNGGTLTPFYAATGDISLFGSLRNLGLGRDHLITVHGDAEAQYHSGRWTDLTDEDAGGVLNQTASNAFTVASTSGASSGDQNRLGAICLNDAPYVLTINRVSGLVKRLRWTTESTTGEWAASDGQFEADLGTHTANARLFCYRRKRGIDVCLAKAAADGTAGATHYYDGSSWNALHADDQGDNNYRPTYIDVGPDDEIVYGNSNFVRRLGAGGWRRVFGSFGLNDDFSVQATASGYVLKNTEATYAQLVSLGAYDYSGYEFQQVGYWTDDSGLQGLSQSPGSSVNALGKRNLTLSRDNDWAIVHRTTGPNLRTDNNGDPWLTVESGCEVPGETPTGGDFPESDLLETPPTNTSFADVLQDDTFGPPALSY